MLDIPHCTSTGERAGFWLTPKPGMDDLQMGGLVVFSLLRGLSSAMKREPQAGASCDIHPHSLLAIAGEARGVAVGPVVYAPHLCREPLPRPSGGRHIAGVQVTVLGSPTDLVG